LKKINVVILGGGGLLGSNLSKNINKTFEIYSYSKNKININQINKLKNIIIKTKPDYLINCAAYTDVDKCENNIKEAYKINSLGPKKISLLCKKFNITLIHISTDYVFNKKKIYKISEKEKENPISVYGKSKLIGEKEIKKNLKKYIILRTSWLYGNKKNNFLNKIIKISKSKNLLNLISDQYSLPTNVINLSRAIFAVIYKIHRDKNKNYYGTYHYSDAGRPISRYLFAKEIFNLMYKNKQKKVIINKIKSKFYYDKNIRPKNSALSSNKIYKIFVIKNINWKYSLKSFIKSNKGYLL
tara:strand:+ start:316 stop:1212 length:897 start_codon:yes stop_codon:yes gene_type:complete